MADFTNIPTVELADLPAAEAGEATDLFLTSKSGQGYKTNLAKMADYILTKFTLSVIDQELDIVTALNQIQTAVGTPLKAATAAEMTNTDRIYIYTGTESGYTAGNWYYYNGAAWVSGGVYNSAAITTDKSFSQADTPADAEKTGTALKGAALRSDSDIKNFDTGYLTESPTFENGNIVDGQDASSNRNYRLRTPGYYPTATYNNLSINRAFKAWATYISYYNYDSSLDVYNFVESSGRNNSASINIDATKGSHFRIMCADVTSNKWTNRIYPIDGIIDYSLHKKSETSENIKSLKATVYLGNGADFNYNRSGNTVTLDFSGASLLIRLENAQSKLITITFSDITTQAAAAGWTATETGVICPTYGCGLYYNTETGSLTFNGGFSHYVGSKYISLFETWYGSFYAGLLVEYATEKRARATIPAAINTLSKGQKAVAYLAGGAEFHFRRSGNTYILNISGANILLRLAATGAALSIPFSDFVTAATTAGWSEYTVNGATLGVVAPHPGCSVYYNLADGSLIFSTVTYMHDISVDSVCLFEGHYDSIAAGLLVDYYEYLRTKNIDKNTSVPEYYTEHMKEKVPEILANMEEAGRNGETFIFITDLHWEQSQNARNSPALINNILSQLNINTIVCGGDLINQGLKDDMVEVMLDAVQSFELGLDFPIAFGNHDSNWNNYDGQHEHPERRLSAGAVYAIMQKQAENAVTYISDPDLDFYYDRPGTKTRFIFLDTHDDFTFTNYGALAACLSATPAGWAIVIIAHAYYAGGEKKAYATNIENIVDAYNARGSVTITETYDFTGAAAKIYLMLGGHVHKDMSWATPAGVPVVLSDCDCFARSLSPVHVKGTITEQCFDVITINYSDNTVKCVRIGRGENRTFPEPAAAD